MDLISRIEKTMSDVREKVIAAIKKLPISADYDDILEAIIIQKQIEESKSEFGQGNFNLHESVMSELNRRINGLE